jgi:hypothetical protein
MTAPLANPTSRQLPLFMLWRDLRQAAPGMSGLSDGIKITSLREATRHHSNMTLLRPLRHMMHVRTARLLFDLK